MKLSRIPCFAALTLAVALSGCGAQATSSPSTTAASAPATISIPGQSTPAISTSTQIATPSQDLASFHAVITGTVQSVGFRDFARSQAFRFNLTGWVQNLPDGTVEVVAEGDRGNLEEYIAQLNIGPPGAIVSKIDTSWITYTGQFSTFSRLN